MWFLADGQFKWNNMPQFKNQICFLCSCVTKMWVYEIFFFIYILHISGFEVVILII